MIYCSKCNAPLKETFRFCNMCGASVAQTVQSNNELVVASTKKPATGTSLYTGSKRTFTFRNTIINISSGMDAFNHYRKVFKVIAREQANKLKAEYVNHITNLDLFLRDFFPMYLRHRDRLIQMSMDIFLQAGIYDISEQEFTEQHTADFCLCMQDLNISIKAFNNTIAANQERKIRNYNMLPGVVFRGLGGLVAATAVNFAVHSIAESDIKNANVTQSQRKELFNRINTDILMERAFLDYWRTFFSLTYWMNKRGLDVWYPNTDANQRARGLYQNLCASRVPKDKEDECLGVLISLNPYNDDYYKFFLQKYGRIEELDKLFRYLGQI